MRLLLDTHVVATRILRRPERGSERIARVRFPGAYAAWLHAFAPAGLHRDEEPDVSRLW